MSHEKVLAALSGIADAAIALHCVAPGMKGSRLTPPQPIREIEHLLIPLHDGTRLAARLWLPTDAEQHPVPAILEYLPYRKRDGTYERDALTHPWLAGHGYAGVRVDLRGCGESAGLLSDEYAT